MSADRWPNAAKRWRPVLQALRAWRVVALGLLASAVLLAAQPAWAAPGDIFDLQDEAARISAQLDARRAEIERASERLNEATDQSARLTATVRQVDAELAAMRAEQTTAQSELDQRARSMYMTGPGKELASFADELDLDEPFQTGHITRELLEAEAVTVQGARERMAALEAQAAELHRWASEQQARAAGFRAQQRRLQRLTDKLQADLDRMDPRITALIADQQRRDEAAARAAWAAWEAGTGKRPPLEAAAVAKAAVRWALAQRGAPYRWGSSGPDTFDCSGLTSAAYAAAGLDIPRVSRQQFRFGRRVAMADLVPGDLVFYASNPRNPATIHHVGMYVGGGVMVHAPYTGSTVRLASVWRKGFAGAVRPVAAIAVSRPHRAPVKLAPTTTRPAPTTTKPAPTTTRPPTTTGPTTTTQPATTTTVPPTSTTSGDAGSTTTTTAA